MKHLLLWSALFFVSPTFALERCSPEFTSVQMKVDHLESLLASKTKSKQANAKLYNKFKEFKAAHPRIASKLQESSVYDVILDDEFVATSKYLDNLLDDLNKSILDAPQKSVNVRLREVLAKHLDGKVPAASIQTRIDEFMDGGSLFRALGEKSVEETALMYHGGNPLEPTADSILGKFIAKHQASTVKRTFSHGPGYTTHGQEKLVIAVDASMMKDFTALMDDAHLFSHYHYPGQGTLEVIHEKTRYNWGGKNTWSKMEQSYQQGTIIPSVFLSSTESMRMSQYMKGMSSEGIREYVMKPWEIQGYCAKGGYSSCTHWVGNLPIGDDVVNAYTFPGKVDNHAYNSIHPDNPELDKLPRTQDLVPYKFPQGLTVAQKSLLSRIWKVPGNQQFSYLTGIGKANEYGQLANPGWVAHIFTSRIKNDRSPVIFFMVDDAKQPIAPDFDPQINAY